MPTFFADFFFTGKVSNLERTVSVYLKCHLYSDKAYLITPMGTGKKLRQLVPLEVKALAKKTK